MGVSPQILFSDVMHARLFPKKNGFSYPVYYVSLPLSSLGSMALKYNRFGFLSFYDKDHGHKDGSDLEAWARSVLAEHNITKADGEITLICMPRVLGYVFNPVSFWLCRDKSGDLRAVLCEVNNTFGERHTYICAHGDQRPIVDADIIIGQKLFHVSPFLEREGHYEFRFDVDDVHFKTCIDFFDAKGKKKLVTSLAGHYAPLDGQNLRKVFWRYPLVTLKTILLIHWQAVKLLLKRVRYVPKPLQLNENVSVSDEL